MDGERQSHDGIGDARPGPAPVRSAYSAYFATPSPTAHAASTIVLPGDELATRDVVVRPALAVLFRIAVGPSADRYVRRFLSFERKGRTRPGWHWPSLFLPGVWAFYRKMWLTGLLFGLLPIAGALAFLLVEPRFPRADIAWIVCAVLAVWVVPGVVQALFADSLLYSHCRYLIARAERGARGATDAVARLSGRSPTSTAAACLAGGGVLAAALTVAVPPLWTAYVELGVRTRIEQAIAAARGLEDEIEATWQSARLVPRQSDHPGLRAQTGSRYISEVDVHPRTGRIRLALAAGVPDVDGKAILLAPTRDANDRWQWMCVPVDIPARYLPAQCRG